MTDPVELAADLLAGRRPPRPGERPRVKVPDDDDRLIEMACIARDIGVLVPDPELAAVLDSHFSPGHFS